MFDWWRKMAQLGKMSLALVAWTLFALLIGFALVWIYCGNSQAIALGAVVYAASMLTGGLVGFIFGVPRVDSVDPIRRPEQGVVGPGAGAGGVLQAGLTARILANTNLEQISDWLTKIIVGVGLIQFRSILDWFNSLAERVGADLGAVAGGTATAPGAAVAAEQGPAGSAVFAGALMIAGVTAGFITGWLFCRLLLATGMRIVDLLNHAFPGGNTAGRADHHGVAAPAGVGTRPHALPHPASGVAGEPEPAG